MIYISNGYFYSHTSQNIQRHLRFCASTFVLLYFDPSITPSYLNRFLTKHGLPLCVRITRGRSGRIFHPTLPYADAMVTTIKIIHLRLFTCIQPLRLKRVFIRFNRVFFCWKAKEIVSMNTSKAIWNAVTTIPKMKMFTRICLPYLMREKRDLNLRTMCATSS